MLTITIFVEFVFLFFVKCTKMDFVSVMRYHQCNAMTFRESIFDPDLHSFNKTHIFHIVLFQGNFVFGTKAWHLVHWKRCQKFIIPLIPKVSIINWSKYFSFFLSFYFNLELPSSSAEIQIECRKHVYLFNTLNKMKRVYTLLFVLLHSTRAHRNTCHWHRMRRM